LAIRTQHSTGVHGAEFPQAKLPDAVAKVIAPDFVMALARAGPTLLFGPRQVSSFDEGGQRYSRICTEPIAIDGLHECRPTAFDFKDIGEIFGAPQPLADVADLAGAILL